MKYCLICLVAFFLCSQASAQILVTSEQAKEIALSFLNRPNAVLSDPRREHDIPSFHPDTYDIEVHTPRLIANPNLQGDYDVKERLSIDAQTGQIYFYEDLREDNDMPIIFSDETAARSIAEMYLNTLSPIFQQSEHQFIGCQDGIARYYVNFIRVLTSDHIAAPGMWVVRISRKTGNVYSFTIPGSDIFVPLTPNLSREQALAVALPYFRLDPTFAPVTQSVLEVGNNSAGVQCLQWSFMQSGTTDAEGNPHVDESLHVDAITGEFNGWDEYWGGVNDPKLINHHQTVWPPKNSCKVKEKQSNLDLTLLPNRNIKGMLWVRPEEFHKLVNNVENTKTGPVLHKGKSAFTVQNLGGRKKGYWMVPLRNIAEKLGYMVTWNQADKSVILTSKDSRQSSYLKDEIGLKQ